jgi:L-serine/L-threonine ammonia-lyase
MTHLALHHITPLLKQYAISQTLHKDIWLKMDCYQPIQSFKIRGIGHLCVHAKQQGYTHLVSASGGNAGYATAYAAYQLGMQATVFMPKHISIHTQNKLKQLNASVVIVGDSIDEAQQVAQTYVSEHNAFFIPPFNHPLIWDGHVSIVDELYTQMQHKPDAIVLSVGGGGLLCGIMKGLEKYHWQHDVAVITSETLGTNSLKQSIDLNELIALKSTQGIATSLAAKKVAQQAFDYAQKYQVKCMSVTDAESLNACVRFAREQNTLVEPACGATLAILYNHAYALENYKNIVFIICGGINTHLLNITGTM